MQRHRKWNRRSAGLVACGLVMAGAGPWTPVRNFNPQRVQEPAREQRPIYYPRLAHRAEPDGINKDQADRLLREFLDLHTAMSYEQAALLAGRLTEILPENPAAHYNLACALGRLHRVDEAVASLERAVDHGWRDLAHLSIDPDLDCIRGTDRYRRLVAGLAGDAGTERSDPAGREGTGWRDVVARLQREVRAELDRLGAAPATVVVVDRGSVAWAGCPGASEIDPTRPVGPDDAITLSCCDHLLALAGRVRTAAPDRTVLNASLATQDIGARAARCRRQVIGPLGMTGTWFQSHPGREVVAHSTARDLARLVAAVSAAGRPADGPSSERVESYELSGVIGPGPPASAVLRWIPGEGRGVVVIATGRHGLDAARRIAWIGMLE